MPPNLLAGNSPILCKFIYRGFWNSKIRGDFFYGHDDGVWVVHVASLSPLQLIRKIIGRYV
jgi:hypothetical protein